MYCTVYLVFDRQLGTEVALKLLDLWDGMDLYRFKGEFRSLADIKHPNLATLHELICEGRCGSHHGVCRGRAL